MMLTGEINITDNLESAETLKFGNLDPWLLKRCTRGPFGLLYD